MNPVTSWQRKDTNSLRRAADCARITEIEFLREPRNALLKLVVDNSQLGAGRRKDPRDANLAPLYETEARDCCYLIKRAPQITEIVILVTQRLES